MALQRKTGDLLVVSNRSPFTFARTATGGLEARRGAGGLVVALGPGVARDRALWVATAATAEEREAATSGLFDEHAPFARPVVVGADDYSAYYDVISNQTLWFCLHGLWDLPRRPRFDRHWWKAWKAFRSVNEQFAEWTAEAAAPGATVLVQDFHLSLVAGLLARNRPDVKTATFIHTPWCTPQELAVLPESVSIELVSGLAGGGACGFHSKRWARAFEGCCVELLGERGRTFVSPAAADVDDLRAVARSEGCDRELAELEASVGERILLVRVDRIEPSKNVLRGFWAFDELLETRSDLRGRVVFAAMVYPSRQNLAEYQAYSQEVDAVVAHVNAKWATPDWTPIVLDKKDNHPRSVAALRRADVLVVNPVRDGLNLVAKEGVAVNERNCALVLSNQAGAWDELGDHALGVNPFDVSGTASALGRAVDMAPPERRERSRALIAAATASTPLDWFDQLLSRAARP